MFLTRKTELNSAPESSLSNGNASIIKSTCKEEPTHVEEEEEEDEKSIDLTIESMSAVIATAVQLSASGGGPPSSLSLGSASILQPFSKLENKATNKNRFSLFSWRKQKEKKEDAVVTVDSNLTFSRSSDEDSSSPSSPRNSSTLPDDGKDELQYRGIQIKEIKTTLKTLVISDDVRNPMPQVKLERPGFARINY
ncbi:hypothetical protein G6F46_008166 [Rhizopus delemar]|nr:hypothetical protein G6F55_010306 [Rhizopus delemar]KAG1548165.1 hypothetical protein G6F51_003828 [Rhizopus arrhizus]KAG1494755.1 hypothetical protein G6F54_007650 [Rhizopus delemar]KAG1508866.1 hypothetical protein G6F53_007871 [Rhizopus delemar]KAG1511816.1 hypothetical protein G6F52_010559 [Rhizopus delemar]